MSVELETHRPIPQAELENLLGWIRGCLGLGEDRRWRVVWSRRKLRKQLFEVEQRSVAGASEWLIGKVYHTDRGAEGYHALKTLWDAGLRPPSRHTVVRPVAYLPERRVLLQEKAPGVQFLEVIRSRSSDALAFAGPAAQWLAALHRLPVKAPDPPSPQAAILRYDHELRELLPDRAAEIRQAAEALLESVSAAPAETVPCHGDFHPMNIFLDETGRVTAIDLDTFRRAERAADAGYLLAQTAIMGYLLWGDFDSTVTIREKFLAAYQAAAGPLAPERLRAHIGFAFFQSLHFELCILHTNNHAIAGPWLRAAREGLP
jgi:hypothetical protein